MPGPPIYPPLPQAIADRSTGSVSRPWAIFFQWVFELLNSASGFTGVVLPGQILLGGADPDTASGATGTGLVNVTGGIYQTPFAASAASKLVGRGSASGAGIWQEVSLGAGLTMASNTLSATGTVLRASRTLTNAEVKALPTTPIQVVTNAGPNTVLVPIKYVLISRFAGGAYTNLNASGWFQAQWGTGGGALASNYLADDAGDGIAVYSGLFGSASSRLALLTDFTYSTTPASGWGNIPGDATPLPTNEALYVRIDNGGSGDLTGGNAANTLTVVTYYVVEAV